MKKYNALIVDDERLARNELIRMLSEFSNIRIIGEAEDVPGAVKAITDLQPNVIFLDIQMPGKSGFDLLNEIETDAKIIFVTAFDEYAIRAFEVNALDYLLKPITRDRLAGAVERLEQDQMPPGLRKLRYDDRLFLMVDSKMSFLKIDSIVAISSAGDYTEIHIAGGEKGLTAKSMKEWETRLPENYFCRIHRSTIINMEYINRLEEWFNYSYRIYMKGLEDPYLLSRRYVARLKSKMG
jgi:two-component system LytT family response regulator